jgi:hypothetical protein
MIKSTSVDKFHQKLSMMFFLISDHPLEYPKLTQLQNNYTQLLACNYLVRSHN